MEWMNKLFAGGKTTLLNHILTAKHGQRIAVIENEFGAVGIGTKKNTTERPAGL